MPQSGGCGAAAFTGIGGGAAFRGAGLLCTTARFWTGEGVSATAQQAHRHGAAHLVYCRGKDPVEHTSNHTSWKQGNAADQRSAVLRLPCNLQEIFKFCSALIFAHKVVEVGEEATNDAFRHPPQLESTSEPERKKRGSQFQNPSTNPTLPAGGQKSKGMERSFLAPFLRVAWYSRH